MNQTEAYVSTAEYIAYGGTHGIPPLSSINVVTYFFPPDLSALQLMGDGQIYDDLYLEFDLMNFLDSTNPNGTVMLEDLVVDKLDVASITGVVVGTFVDFSDWNWIDAVAFSSPAHGIDASNKAWIESQPAAASLGGGFYGGWESPAGVIALNDNKLYKVSFTLISDAVDEADRANMPRFRVRVFSSDRLNTSIVSNDSVANVYGTGVAILETAPSNTGNIYTVYFEPITPVGGWAVSDTLCVAVDIVDWNDEKAGTITLDEVVVEQLDPPGL